MTIPLDFTKLRNQGLDPSEASRARWKEHRTEVFYEAGLPRAMAVHWAEKGVMLSSNQWKAFKATLDDEIALRMSSGATSEEQAKEETRRRYARIWDAGPRPIMPWNYGD